MRQSPSAPKYEGHALNSIRRVYLLNMCQDILSLLFFVPFFPLQMDFGGKVQSQGGGNKKNTYIDKQHN